MDKELQRAISTVIVNELAGVLPVPVIVRFEQLHEERAHLIKVYWQEYQLSWTGRVEGHRVQAQELVRLSFNRNWLTRAVGRFVAPFVQNYVSAYPIVLMPDTNIRYPSGRESIKVFDEEWGAGKDYDEGRRYLLSLASLWAFKLHTDIIRERGGEETV